MHQPSKKNIMYMEVYDRKEQCMRNYNMAGNIEHSCACMKDSIYGKEDFVVAMAYVPWQHFTNAYEADKALEVGTIFPELDKPFWAARGCGKK